MARHLVVVGPTASGKSALAVEIARRRNAAGRRTEIVSCDSMAVYRGMDIGTATPAATERAGVVHHLLDVVEPSEEFSLQQFVTLADAALDDIERRGSAAILVGGTGLYVQAVVDRFELPGRYPAVVAELESVDTEDLARRLRDLDPVAASRVPPGNRRRLVRALEVTIGSGRRFSDAGPGMGAFGPTPFVLVGLHVERDQLAAAIEDRLRRQLDAGFLEEVRALLDRVDPPSRTAAEALGYRELAMHLRGRTDLDEAVALTARRTRRLAVRQQRWFRRDPRIRWYDAPTDGRSRAFVAEAVDGLWDGEDVAGQVDRAGGDPTATVGPSCCD